jgi:hypothetical protein
MIVFWICLGLVSLAVAGWAARSSLLRAHLRGRGSDPGVWGNKWEHMADQGFGQSWNDDGSGGRRASRLESRFTRRNQGRL